MTLYILNAIDRSYLVVLVCFMYRIRCLLTSMERLLNKIHCQHLRVQTQKDLSRTDEHAKRRSRLKYWKELSLTEIRIQIASAVTTSLKNWTSLQNKFGNGLWTDGGRRGSYCKETLEENHRYLTLYLGYINFLPRIRTTLMYTQLFTHFSVCFLCYLSIYPSIDRWIHS